MLSPTAPLDVILSDLKKLQFNVTEIVKAYISYITTEPS